MIETVIWLLGVLTLVSTLRSFWPFLAPLILGSVDLKKKGKWVVVTGATDGIGKAYCENLAKKGLNVVLISRTLSRLQDFAAELEKTYKVKTKVVAADFSKINSGDDAAWTPIKAAIKDEDIALLVNNVGMSYEYPSKFSEDDSSVELLENLMKLNVRSTTLMLKLVMPGMVTKRSGAVINISSAAGCMACGSPMLAGYSATKAYVNALSKSVQYEVSSKGVICQTHCPYFVKTKMAKMSKSLMVPTPDVWVDSSLKMLGHGGTTVVPFFWHFVQHFATMCLPEELTGWYTLSLHEGIRVRALKKKEKLAKEAEAAKTK